MQFSLKTEYNTNIAEIENKITDLDHAKYIITYDFNKLTSDNFATKLTQGNLASSNDTANFIKKADFDDKLKILKEKNNFK